MILVTFAVPFESAEFRKRSISQSVRIVHTGVGPESAHLALSAVLTPETPSLVICSGFAGGLATDLAIGELIVEGTAVSGSWRHGRFAVSPEVLATAQRKQAFHERTQAEAVDMESGALAEICRGAGIPFVIARSISDTVNDDLGLPPEQLEALARHPILSGPKLFWTLLRDGERRRAFLRMVRDCKTAQQSLADGLEELLLTLQKREPLLG